MNRACMKAYARSTTSIIQPLHFVVVRSRYFGPWNDAEWAAYRHI